MAENNGIQMMKFQCPHCKSEFRFEKRVIISQLRHPYEVEGILDEWYFDFTCPHCEKEFCIDFPIIYYDEESKFIMLSSGKDQKVYDRFEETFVEDDTSVNDAFMNRYEGCKVFRLVQSKEELIEKMRIKVDELDDRVIEYIKYDITNEIKERFLFDVEFRYSGKKDDELLYEAETELGSIVCHVKFEEYEKIYDLMEIEFVNEPMLCKVSREYIKRYIQTHGPIGNVTIQGFEEGCKERKKPKMPFS